MTRSYDDNGRHVLTFHEIESSSALTVEELRELLEEFPADAVVRVAQQPSYPLRARVVALSQLQEGDTDAIVWIATSEVSSRDEHPYAPLAAWSGEGI
jgi:hypothetical protein